MEAELTKRLFSVAEYHRMGESGILHPAERVELIDGEIIRMSPIGRRHAVCVARTTTFFIRAFDDMAVVGPGNPVRLTDWTEPQPDLVVYKPRGDFYAKKRPTIEDVLLILEVSDTTLSYDQKIKVPLFAAAGIPEVWIADLKNEVLHLYRAPRGKRYKSVQMLHPGDLASPLAFPDTSFQVHELLSTDFEE